METLLIVGKILFAYLFVTSGINHFKNANAMIGYAKYKNLPNARFNVFASGVLLIVAPILYVFGVAEVYALSALLIFLVSTALLFHAYWKESDPQTKMNEMISFNKELSLIGAIIALISLA